MRDSTIEAAPARTVKFLVTDRCNISCTFCHNEFQGDPSRPPGGERVAFDEARVKSLLEEVSESSRHPIRVKISGGEPLLHPDQVSKLMQWSAGASPQESILMSNLTPPRGAADAWLADLGFSEARLNVPSVSPRDYSKLTGNLRLPLSVVLDRCSRVRSRGLHVRFNAVIDQARVTRAQRVVTDYLRQLEALCVADEVVFILDARYPDQTAGLHALISAVESHTGTTVRPRGTRKWETLWRGTTVCVARCIMWETDDPARMTADIYVRPPGVRQTEFAPGKAFMPPRTQGRHGI
jgi:pyruvate-formate lyase-activating enzyme